MTAQTNIIEGKMKRTDVNLKPYSDFDYPLSSNVPKSGGWSAGSDGFRVEEIPLYLFCGEGEHAALTIEKTGVTTRDLAVSVAQILGLDQAAVGYAGMKDKVAVTVQSFTVYGAKTDDAARAFEEAGCKVLTASRHRNKLRLGHLAGNRFTAFIADGNKEDAEKVFKILAETGVPNYFGPQRFGADGTNAAEGLKALTGKRKMGRWKRDLAVSALQSLLFNELLARRMERGEFNLVRLGDALQKTDSGGIFICEDLETDSERAKNWEVSVTGPLFGKKMKKTQGGPGEEEGSIAGEFGLPEDLFNSETGARRPYRFSLQGAEVIPAQGGITLMFACPPGSFATSVIREVAASGVRRA